MSLIRTAVVLGAVIMLLPTDERRKTEFSDTAGMAVERTVTFCERNPGSCAAGRELWDTFLRKAEFGMELASGLARDYMARGREPAQNHKPQDQRPPVASQRPPALPNVRIEPATSRGTLTRADLEPQWRGAPAR